MYPAEDGIVEDKAGLEGFVHHWAVVGRLLGIEDRFNLALHPSRSLYMRIQRNLFACFLTMDLPLSCILESHLLGIAAYFHGPPSPAAILYIMASHAGLPNFKGN